MCPSVGAELNLSKWRWYFFLQKIKVDHVGVEDRQDLEEGELNEEAKDESAPFYDKAKSFFDKISCDAIESSKGNNRNQCYEILFFVIYDG